MSLAYYNEIDPRAAQWLRNLIDAGAIAPGVVDERDLRDVAPDELTNYTQCHFFAGVGVWSYALRLAGWPDDQPVWTGSCPCQPFSTAGKGAGFADERHLWPAWHHLIRVNRPAVVFGEQVASRDGLGWLDLVHADLEGENYSVRAVDTCSAGFGAPHIRQRLWFVAHADRERLEERIAAGTHGPRRCRGTHVLADTHSGRRLRCTREGRNADAGQTAQDADRNPGRGASGVVDNNAGSGSERPGSTNGHWRDADWIGCRDGRFRAVEPGSSPLVDGLAGRVGLLRGYGNAINAINAAEVIRAAAVDLDCGSAYATR